VLNVKDDEVGQAGGAVAITAVFARHHHKLRQARAPTAQFMLGRAKSSSSAGSPRN